MKKSICIVLVLALMLTSFALISCDKHQHNYVSEITTYPTCSQDGVRTFTCEQCGDSYTVAVAKVPTLHSYKVTEQVDATATTDGRTVYTCEHCGDSYTDVIPATGQGTTHTCQSACPTCGKCTDASCTESACLDKCAGHAPAHVCTSVCSICGNCTNTSCTESACATKCQGHQPVHTCESICDTCGKCTDASCTESACLDKCAGHAPAHVCTSVCSICGNCTNTSCTESACATKCQGHNQQGGDTPVKLFMVGDSTVCNYGSETDKVYPRNGYGMWVGNYLNSNVTVVNLALSGRSSKSFLAEANYQSLLSQISAGDYLMIGFGHNDEKSDDATRYTNPTGDVNDQTSFQYHLYTYYIKVALDAGATPILCTPIVRRDINGNYAGSSGHVTNGGDYAQAIIDLGAKYNVTVINLRDLTKELYSSLSNEQTAKMHATSGAVETVIDNTHLNSYGAAHVAYMLCKQLATTSNGLAAYVDQSKLVAPVYEKVIVKNQFDQPEDGDVTVYGSWELTTYTNHGQGKHQGINLIYYCAGPMEGKVSGGVGYVKATDSAGNGTVKDGVIGTEKGYLEFIPETDGQITIPLKKATSKTLFINSINNETYAVTLVGSFAAGLEEQTGEGYTVTLQDDRFNLTLDVKYGYTYRIAIQGSKMCVYDCTWVPSQNGGGGSQDQEEVLEPTVDLTPTNTVVVMLDGDYTNADLSKLQLKAYNSDFYGLNYKLDQTLTIVDYVAELVEGKTKVTFTVAEQVYGIYVADHNTVPTYDADKTSAIISRAANAVTWQLDNGGWDKDYTTHISRAWNGTESKITKGWTANGKDLGTIDNDGTYSEMRLIAEAYLLTADSTQKQTFLASFTKAMTFLQNLQYPTGGFAQVYPRRGQYSDNVTFNDNAMVNVLKLLQDMSLSRYPFGEDSIADTATKELATTMVSKGVEYILQSQIVVNGTKTGWCAQHHPSTYAPVKARVYEHVSISGSESVEIIKFLLTQVDNAKAQSAAKAAIAYLDSVKLENTTYDNQTAPYIYEKQGETVWYRFYEIGTNKGIFSDMSGEIKYDITQISEERRTGYNWCVDTPKKLLKVYNEVGYYANKVVVVASAEITGNGCSITSGSVINVETPFVAE